MKGWSFELGHSLQNLFEGWHIGIPFVLRSLLVVPHFAGLFHKVSLAKSFSLSLVFFFSLSLSWWE